MRDRGGILGAAFLLVFGIATLALLLNILSRISAPSPSRIAAPSPRSSSAALPAIPQDAVPTRLSALDYVRTALVLSALVGASLLALLLYSELTISVYHWLLATGVIAALATVLVLARRR